MALLVISGRSRGSRSSHSSRRANWHVTLHAMNPGFVWTGALNHVILSLFALVVILTMRRCHCRRLRSCFWTRASYSCEEFIWVSISGYHYSNMGTTVTEIAPRKTRVGDWAYGCARFRLLIHVCAWWQTWRTSPVMFVTSLFSKLTRKSCALCGRLSISSQKSSY